MKKIILSAIAIFTIGFANAQKAEFGIKGGLNISNFSGDTGGMNLKSRVGFNVGAFAAIKLSEKVTLQPELLYSTQGSKFNIVVNSDGANYDTENTFKLAYINIPVMFKYYASKKFSLEAGPQIGFLVDSKLEVKVIGQSVTQDAKDYSESVDFGLNFGAGYDFNKKVFAGIRYNLGLSNVFKTESGDNSKSQNSVFSLSLGYKF